MAKAIFAANGLTGGTAGKLDDILHTAVEDGNIAIVLNASDDTAYFYKYDASEAGAESSPDIIIPDSNVSGTGAWIKLKANVDDLTVTDDAAITDALTVGGTAAVTGVATFSDNLRILADSKSLIIGAGSDFQIVHDGTNTNVTNATGNLYLNNSASNIIFNTDSTNRWYIEFATGNFLPSTDVTYDIGDATHAVNALYIGDNGEIKFGNDVDAYIKYNTATPVFLLTNNTGDIRIQNLDAVDGIVEFRTNSTARWQIGFGGALIPAASDTYDLGSTTREIANIYLGADGAIFFGTSQPYKIDAETGLRLATTTASDIYFEVNGTVALRLDESFNRATLNSDWKFVSEWAYNNARTGRIMEVDSTGLIGYDSSSKLNKEGIKYVETEPSMDTSFLYDLKLAKYKYKAEVGGTGNERYGLIAEDVAEVAPELVFYDEGVSTPAGIYHLDLIGVLINEIQNLKKEIDKLKTK